MKPCCRPWGRNLRFSGESIPEIEKVSGKRLAEGISRLREGRVEKMPGFDEKSCTIRLFSVQELEETEGQMDLFASFGVEKKDAATSKGLSSGQMEQAPAEIENRTKEGLEKVESTEIILPNPAQQEAIETVDRAVAVIAGPGTGKTRTLISRILWLLQKRKAGPSEITAVTFTNKAAGEMKDRLKKELGSARSLNRLQIGKSHSICLKAVNRKNRGICHS